MSQRAIGWFRNSSRSLGALLIATAGVFTVIACAGGDEKSSPLQIGSSGGTSGSSGDNPLPHKDGGVDGARSDAGDGGEDGPPRDYTIPTPTTLYTVCTRESVGLDVSVLTPDPTLPSEFLDAWSAEASGTVIPGFALLFNALDRGPVDAWIGSVGPENVGYSFLGAPKSASNLPVLVDTANLKHLKVGPMPTAFEVAFGTSLLDRHEFAVSALVLDGTFDATCSSFTGTVTLTIPGTEAQKVFGSETMGSLLGGFIDTNGDNVLDGWKIQLAGTAPAAEVSP